MDDPSVMPARLAAFLAANEPDATDIEVTGYEVMTGGYSRLLARADVTWRRGGALEQTTFVLRGDPPADRSLIHTDRLRVGGAAGGGGPRPDRPGALLRQHR